MKIAYKAVFSLVILVFLCHYATAVGIQYDSTNMQMVFSPGAEKTYTFNLVDAARIGAYVEGNLSQYATIIDASPDTGPRTIQVKIKLPDQLAPGWYIIWIGAREESEVQGTASGIAVIRVRIPLLSLFLGTYPALSTITVPNVNVNQLANITLSVYNFGTDAIGSSQGIIDVYDPDNNFITTLYTNILPIESDGNVNLITQMDTSKFSLAPGIYTLSARLHYDGKDFNQTLNQSFSLGSLKVTVGDETHQVYANATNKYSMNIQSDWSGAITNVYAVITMPDKQSLKTPTADLIKQSDGRLTKATANLETYWEVKNLEPGNYTVNAKLFYSGVTSEYELPVEVIIGRAPPVQMPTQFQILGYVNNKVIIMNMTVQPALLLMILLAVVVIFNIYYFLLRKDSKNKNQPDISGSGKQEDKSGNNQANRPPRL